MRINYINASAISTLFFSFLFFSHTMIAQEKSEVTEPPIPIYIVCPYHEDSLKAAISSGSVSGESAINLMLKRYDTLQIQIIEASAKNTAYFTWLYTLISLLGALVIVMILSITRIKKELSQIRRIENQHTMSSIPISVPEVKPTPEDIQVTEQKETHPISRSRRTRSKKN